MDQPEMNQTKQTDETDTVAAPVGRVGGRRPSTLSIGDGTPGGAPETGPFGPGQRWSLARKRAVVLRLLRGERGHSHVALTAVENSLAASRPSLLTPE
jgi:hypothetical protein